MSRHSAERTLSEVKVRSSWRTRWVCTRAGGEDHRDRRAVGAERLVGQDDVDAAAAHGVLGLAPDARERVAQRVAVAAAPASKVQSISHAVAPI